MFDLRTHIRDPKTQEIVRRQPYRLVCEGAERYYLRDGLKYHLDGTLFPGQAVPEPKAATPEVDPRDLRIAALESTSESLMRSNQQLQTTIDKLFAKLDQLVTPGKPAVTSDGVPVEPSMPNFDEPAAETPAEAADAPRGRGGRGKREEKVA